jgi:hypothetical protein
MSSLAAANRVGQTAAGSMSYERFAGTCALLAGLAELLYSIAFVVLRSDALSAIFLVVGGLLSAVALVAVYGRLRETDDSFALLALVLGITGGLGAAIHGGFDLSNTLHPPTTISTDLPSQIDPRGLLTFGCAGLGLGLAAWLILRGGRLPSGLGYLGLLTGVLLIVTYLARLIVLDPTSPVVLVPAVLTGFLASPIWYVWLGLSLWRTASASRMSHP